MTKALIFDFDYTLGDSTQGIVLSANDALEQLQYDKMSTEEIRQTIGLSLTETFKKLTASEDKEKAEAFANFFKKKADEVMVENTVLYEGVMEKLQQWKEQGYQTAIVTTKFHYRIDQILSKFQANHLIDRIIGAEDVKVEKPSPEGLLEVIRRLGLEKEEVLYVGDSFVDAQTAQNAGVCFVGVLTGTTTKEEFQQYHCRDIVENVKDINV